jgi:hypothetical protein
MSSPIMKTYIAGGPYKGRLWDYWAREDLCAWYIKKRQYKYDKDTSGQFYSGRGDGVFCRFIRLDLVV